MTGEKNWPNRYKEGYQKLLEPFHKVDADTDFAIQASYGVSELITKVEKARGAVSEGLYVAGLLI